MEKQWNGVVFTQKGDQCFHKEGILSPALPYEKTYWTFPILDYDNFYEKKNKKKQLLYINDDDDDDNQKQT